MVYHRPTELAEALELLRDDPTLTVIAGGTDVYPAWTGAAANGGARGGKNVLDISGIWELREHGEFSNTWVIGSLMTWTDLAKSNWSPHLDALKLAGREVGGIQIQNRGTIVGNICTASPAGDSIPCLLALDATVHIASHGCGRSLPIDQFIIGYRKTALQPGELVVRIQIPNRWSNSRSHFLKLGARRYLVISVAMASGTFEIDKATGFIHSARIAVGACSPVARRLRRLEQRLAGTVIGEVMPEADDLAHLEPIDDVRASAEYRRAAALQLVADLIRDVDEMTKAAR